VTASSGDRRSAANSRSRRINPATSPSSRGTARLGGGGETVCAGAGAEPSPGPTGRYLWNSGIFVWKAATILAALAERQPDCLRHLEAIADAWDGPDRERVFAEEFAAIKGISIDYAVLEHARDVAVIEAPFGWDDLGGWSAVARQRGEDPAGNTVIGRHIGIDSRGTIVHTDEEHLVVTLGLEDMLVVHTPDATLVASRAHEEAVRKVVAELESRGWKDYL